MILAGVLVATLVEAFLPKEELHVFEMVSEQVAEERTQSPQPQEIVQNFSLPQVDPVRMPEINTDPIKPLESQQNPVETESTPVESLMSYEDFIKNNPIKQPVRRKPQQNYQPVTPPIINAEQFSNRLESSLVTINQDTSVALNATQQTALQNYGYQLNRRLNQAWIKPENLSGINLIVEVKFNVSSSGQISNIQFRPGSGNAAFDESVRAAFARVGSGGATPTGKSHTFTLTFKMVN